MVGWILMMVFLWFVWWPSDLGEQVGKVIKGIKKGMAGD